MNVSLSSRHAVHTTRDGLTGPACHAFGAPHGSESYRVTTREVTCKKCLKVLADEAESEAAYAERLAASMMPSSDFHATPEDAEQPVEIVEIREAAEAEAETLRAAAHELRTRAIEGVIKANPTEDPFAEAPIVAELNGRAPVWAVQHYGRTMWVVEGVPGVFTTKAKATEWHRRMTLATLSQQKQMRNDWPVTQASSGATRLIRKAASPKR